uniref:Domain X domain-containing protein n=1 Tax=Candida corydali TaxID=391826 RepID=S5TGJ0_9ASCO|nr:hypothetical protein [Candida corydali]AGS44547.1 hypothetical protein [Candida corydali]
MYYYCVLTLARKNKLKTMKKAIRKYGENLTQFTIDKKGNKVVYIEFTKYTFMGNLKRIKQHGDFLLFKGDSINDPLRFIDEATYMYRGQHHCWMLDVVYVTR